MSALTTGRGASHIESFLLSFFSKKRAFGDGVAEIADVVHSVVEFLDHAVIGCVVVPGVELKFADGVGAGGIKKELVGFKKTGDNADSVKDSVVGAVDGEFAVPPDGFDEGGGRGVDDDLLDEITRGELFESIVVFLVGELASGGASVVIEFSDTDSAGRFQPPKAHGAGVEGAVVNGNIV